MLIMWKQMTETEGKYEMSITTNTKNFFKDFRFSSRIKRQFQRFVFILRVF